MTRCPGVAVRDGGAHGFDDADDLMARPVGQRDKGVMPPGRVQVRSADARHEGADQGFARAGGRDLRRLDSDPAWVDDDASHAGQGEFLSGPAGRGRPQTVWRSGRGR